MNLNEIKNTLENKKDDILERLEKINEDKTKKSGPISADFAEQAVDLENNEVLDQLDDMERAELNKINAALAKIEAGTYGVCISCEEPIGEKRLVALPTAAQCVRCSSENE